MTQRPLNSDVSGTSGNILTRIREDMEVYALNGDRIGEVDFVYMGASSPAANETGTGAATAGDINMRDRDSIIDAVARAFTDDNIPDVLEARLRHDGFIRLDSDGLFSSDRYILPDQIASVNQDGVHLRVNKADLIKD